MISVPNGVIHTGVLLPDPALHSVWFSVLAAFVATNTLMYAALAVTKILPKLYLSDWTRRRDQRSETRSIHPATHPSKTHPANNARSASRKPAKSGDGPNGADVGSPHQAP